MRLFVQTRIALGIPENVWQELRKFIADTIDNLGDQFCPVPNAAWLVYIQEVYPVEGGQVLEAPMSGSVLVGEDDLQPSSCSGENLL